MPPDPAFAEDIYRYGKSAKFAKYLYSEPFLNLGEAGRFIETLQRDNQSGTRLYWIVTMKDDDTAVGTLGFIFPFALRHRCAEFGYGISEKHWGTGIFAEAAGAVISYGFDTLGLVRVQAIMRVDNQRSARAVENLGFRNEAQLESFYETQSGRTDAVLLALVAPRFRRERASQMNEVRT